jgi:hypothetical protein
MRAVVRSAILIAALAAPLAASAQPAQSPAAPSVKIPATLPPDVAFAQRLAFIRAELLAADVLVKKGGWTDARPHAEFPREEVYGVIRKDLRTYRVPAFDGALRELAGAIRAHNVKTYERALGKVQASLAAADTTLKTRQPDWPHFTVQVAVATLPRVRKEVDDAASNGVRAIGYQSTRGLVFEVERMINSVLGELDVRDVQAAEQLHAQVWRLKTFFEPLAPQADAPPERPETIKGVIAEIEAIAQRL